MDFLNKLPERSKEGSILQRWAFYQAVYSGEIPLNKQDYLKDPSYPIYKATFKMGSRHFSPIYNWGPSKLLEPSAPRPKETPEPLEVDVEHQRQEERRQQFLEAFWVYCLASVELRTAGLGLIGINIYMYICICSGPSSGWSLHNPILRGGFIYQL